MVYDPNPEPVVRKSMLEQQLQGLKQQHYQLAIQIIVVEAQTAGTEEEQKVVDGQVKQLKRQQKNTARAGERISSELDTVVAQVEKSAPAPSAEASGKAAAPMSSG